jgi:heterodisulfide reductase subunit C
MENSLTSEVQRLSGENIDLCYHCHKCTAGCPVVQSMTYGPDRMLRMVALEQREALLQSQDIWLCAGCYTCATRCPNDIDISAVMDALRQVAIASHATIGERDALLFHRLSYIPKTQDMGAGLNLFIRGKVPILPHYSAKAASDVRQIFQKSEAEDH